MVIFAWVPIILDISMQISIALGTAHTDLQDILTLKVWSNITFPYIHTSMVSRVYYFDRISLLSQQNRRLKTAIYAGRRICRHHQLQDSLGWPRSMLIFDQRDRPMQTHSWKKESCHLQWNWLLTSHARLMGFTSHMVTTKSWHHQTIFLEAYRISK